MNFQQELCVLFLFLSSKLNIIFNTSLRIIYLFLECVLAENITCNVCDYYDDCKVNTEVNASACWVCIVCEDYF